MANETEISNAAHATDVISDAISAALVQSVVVLPHVYAENLPVGTAVKKFRKDGSLTAETVTESSSYTFSASSELTQTSVDCTAVKAAVATKLTFEAQTFTQINVPKIASEQGRALARLLDDDVLALFTGFTNSVTASSIMTVADLMKAAYTVRASLAGGIGEKLVGILDYKGVFEIQKELMQSAAAALSQAPLITLLTGLPQLNGYCGSIPGVDIYQTNGLEVTGTDDIAAVFNPSTTFCGIYSPSVTTVLIQAGSAGGWTEVYSYLMRDTKEWNDTAGVKVFSDT